MAIRRPPPLPILHGMPFGPGNPRVGRPIRRPRLEGRPRKDLTKWLQGKFGGIGGLREKLLNLPFFEGRQFPTGIPEQLAPINQFGGTVVPRDPQQPAPINQFGGTVVRRGLEDMMMYPGGTPGFYDHGTFDLDLPRAPSPEEITQQRIDQVSQFEQEPMMEAQNEYLYGYAGGGIADLLHYYGR